MTVVTFVTVVTAVTVLTVVTVVNVVKKIHQETHAKNTKSRKSSLGHFLDCIFNSRRVALCVSDSFVVDMTAPNKSMLIKPEQQENEHRPLKKYSKRYEDACKRLEDEDKSFKEQEIVLSDSSNLIEEYLNAEDYFTDEEKSLSEGEYEAAEKYFSDEDTSINFRFDAQNFTNPKRLRNGDPLGYSPLDRKKCCETECFKFISTVSLAAKNEIREKFKCKLLDCKNKLLEHLKNTCDVQMEDYSEEHNSFYFEQNRICPTTYSELTGVSTYILNKVRADFNSGRKEQYEHGNIGKGRMTAAGANCLAFILEFSRKYAQESPDEKLVILPKIFIVSELYYIYKSEVKGKIVEKKFFL